MKVELQRKANWVFGWELWDYLGTTRFDIGFWHWHIYFYFREAKE